MCNLIQLITPLENTLVIFLNFTKKAIIAKIPVTTSHIPRHRLHTITFSSLLHTLDENECSQERSEEFELKKRNIKDITRITEGQSRDDGSCGKCHLDKARWGKDSRSRGCHTSPLSDSSSHSFLGGETAGSALLSSDGVSWRCLFLARESASTCSMVLKSRLLWLGTGIGEITAWRSGTDMEMCRNFHDSYDEGDYDGNNHC